MQLDTVTITTADVASAADFYGHVLDLPVRRLAETAEVTIGDSTLVVQEGPTGPGVDHLAFTVPSNRFDEARDWVAERVGLLTAADGRDVMRLGGVWNSESVYFPGPDGAILEFIARHSRDDATDHAFTSADVVSISEIGIGVDDVTAAVAHLTAAFGLAVFGEGSAEFTPVGDQEGLLIVVARDRAWFPTGDRVAQGGPLEIAVGGVRPGEVALSGEHLVLTRELTPVA